MHASAQRIGKKAVHIANGVVNAALLVAILLLIAFACYALWDSGQVLNAADAARYEIYKPTALNEGLGFAELRALNPEVFAWLTVYGTHIDYPVAQGEDNMKYVNHNALGGYSLTGSIFLDTNNKLDFSDYNSILFGHHMEKQAMFGGIGLFSQKEYFDARPHGNLYYGGADHGLEFFAFLHVDAYDASVFTPGVQGDADRQAYLDNLLDKATFTRDIGVTVQDKIVLLSTCSDESTNGRDILVARVADSIYEDTFQTDGPGGANANAAVDAQDGLWAGIPVWLWALPPVLAVLVAVICMKRRKDKDREK